MALRSRCAAPRLLLLATLYAAPALASGGGDPGHGPSMTHRMMVLALQLGAILFAARVGGMVFERLRMPGVVGELMAGVAIGPHLLGSIPVPGFPDGLFHVPAAIAVGDIPVSPELYGVCVIASIVLLFMVGLETDIKLFMRYSVAGSLVGVGGVAVSFLTGAGMIAAFSPMLFGHRLGLMAPECMFMGIVSTATSVGITARILSEQRKMESPEGVTILAGAVVDDVLGIILLAIGLGVISASSGHGGIDWGQIAVIAAKAVGIWLLATVAGLLAARRIGAALKSFGDRSVIAVMALGMALVLAGLFEEAGLAMIIGAYVMGVSLSRTDLNHVIREKLHPLHVFLVPVFFAVMGMMVNVRLLLSTKVLGFGAAFFLAAAAAKIVGCGIPALFANFTLRGALRIGAGMLPRGEVTLIIAGTGLAAGLLTPELFGVVIFMTLAAAIGAPPLLVALFKSPVSGVRKQVVTAADAKLAFPFPSVEAAELLLAKLLRAFETEGFFIHTLSRSQHLYQLRKDDAVIGLRHDATDIVFECRETEAAFVNTAMLEVVAELEKTIRELRKPLDIKAIGKRLQESPVAAEPARSFAGFISRDVLCPDLKGATKPAIIDELLVVLDRTGQVNDLPAARAAVLEREASMSTGMQYGVAIPHARTDAVDRLICALGIHHEGIDFDSIDEKPTHIVVLTLSPTGVAAPHMQFMSMVSQALDQRGRTALLACDTADEMYAVLTGQTAAAKAPSATDSVMRMMHLKKEAKPTLADFLKPELLLTGLPGDSKGAVLDALFDAILAADGVLDRDAARRAILDREAQMSTGLERGIAIPHARTDAVDRMICLIATKPEGVDFDSLDGAPSHIFIMILAPVAASAPYLQVMGLLNRALEGEARERVIAAPSPQALWKLLVG